MAKVAFLGLGVMGYPMAGHLAAGGHEVTVYNRSAAKAAKWTKQHKGKSAKTPREARPITTIQMFDKNKSRTIATNSQP